MPDPDPRYFDLNLHSLRSLAGWAADCAGHALPVFEQHAASDPRPRAAIEGARVFAAGGRRTAQLRTLALAAHAAARAVTNPAAAAAARAAGHAAASAYTHPLRDVDQTKHIVAPAAYAALALELAARGPAIADTTIADASVGDAVVRLAIARAPAEVRAILLNMHPRQPGASRLDQLFYALDAGIRALHLPPGA